MGARYSCRPSELVGIPPEDPDALGLDYLAFQAGARERSDVKPSMTVAVAAWL